MARRLDARTRSLARAALLAGVTWALLALALDLAAGWEAVRTRTVSELVHERPIAFRLSLVANAAATGLVGLVVRRSLDGDRLRSGDGLLVAAAATLVAAAIPTDAGDLETVAGGIHSASATLAFLALVASMGRATWCMRETPAWATAFGPALVLWSLAAAALAHLGLLLLVKQFTVTAWVGWLGVAERVVLVANMAWLLHAAARSARRHF